MHIKFFRPIVTILQGLGGSGSLTEIKDRLIETLSISDEELEEKLKNGVSKIDSQIAWSKIYLTRSDLLTIKDNIWSLTEKGVKSTLTDDDAIAIFKNIHREFVTRRWKTKESGEDEDETPVEVQEHRDKLLSVLRSLPPEGFERICQRVLRESGFTKVIVTGKSGDGGIDGEGILKINPLVSLKVIFQAKRYKDAVSASQVRDFRGAMQGRAEKGIILTTGRFTADARKEAIREGTPPIELVDGDNLVDLFEQKYLGLKSKMVYEIDYDFFDEYQ